MKHGNGLFPLRYPLPRGDFVNRAQQVCVVVPVSASITDPDHNILQNDKAALMFERFAIDCSRLNCAVAILTLITVLVHNN